LFIFYSLDYTDNSRSHQYCVGDFASKRSGMEHHFWKWGWFLDRWCGKNYFTHSYVSKIFSCV